MSELLKIACFRCEQRMDLTAMEPFSKVNCPACGIEITVPSWFDGNYLLEDYCALNTTWTTYRALDLTLDREVAIKVLNREFSSQAEELKELFLEKGRVMARLNHPGIIGIYHCGEFQKQPYLVMQYMVNGSLDTILKESVTTPALDEKAKWMKQIAQGLQEAKRLKVLHHEVCPGNVLMDAERDVRIGDFGLTYAFEAIGVNTEIDIRYLSPERLNGIGEDHFGDIYSLGIMMYELFTGVLPFPAEELEAAKHIRMGKIQPPRSLRKDIPDFLSQLIMKTLQPKIDERPDYPEIVSILEACSELPEDYSDSGSFWKKLFGS